jgi:hypothetical protein
MVAIPIDAEQFLDEIVETKVLSQTLSKKRIDLCWSVVEVGNQQSVLSGFAIAFTLSLSLAFTLYFVLPNSCDLVWLLNGYFFCCSLSTMSAKQRKRFEKHTSTPIRWSGMLMTMMMMIYCITLQWRIKSVERNRLKIKLDWFEFDFAIEIDF